jgi:hypothetical protein
MKKHHNCAYESTHLSAAPNNRRAIREIVKESETNVRRFLQEFDATPPGVSAAETSPTGEVKKQGKSA